MRKAAVQSLSTVAHHKPRLLAGRLPPLLPKLYAQTVVDESLIRIVDLGPFKHRIDDGLELRKVLNQVHNVRVFFISKMPCRKGPGPVPGLIRRRFKDGLELPDHQFRCCSMERNQTARNADKELASFPNCRAPAQASVHLSVAAPWLKHQ